MADQTLPPRPEVVRDSEGRMTNPEGWSLVLVGRDQQTVVAAWDDNDVFWQWESTESIVRQLVDALAELQMAWAASRGAT